MPGAKADRLSSHRAKRSADGAPGFLGAGKSERTRLLPTVRYLERTRDGLLRQPVFVRLREYLAPAGTP